MKLTKLLVIFVMIDALLKVDASGLVSDVVALHPLAVFVFAAICYLAVRYSLSFLKGLIGY